MTDTPEIELFTVKQVADRYKVADRTVRRWIREGRIGARKIRGYHVRFTQDDLETFDAASVVQL